MLHKPYIPRPPIYPDYEIESGRPKRSIHFLYQPSQWRKIYPGTFYITSLRQFRASFPSPHVKMDLRWRYGTGQAACLLTWESPKALSDSEAWF